MHIENPSSMFKEILRYLLFDLWFNDLSQWTWRLHNKMKLPDGMSHKGSRETVAVPSDIIEAAYGKHFLLKKNFLCESAVDQID